MIEEGIPMFQIFKKKTSHLIAPIDGKVISLDDVPDSVFAQRMMGDGVAISASGTIAYAPADGEITVTIESKHAFGMWLDNGMELIVHVGVDHNNTQESEFEMLVNEHDFVKAGTPIMKITRKEHTDAPLITPVIVTNPECFTFVNLHIGEDVKGRESLLIEYR